MRSYSLFVEHGLHETPLSQMKVTLAGDEAFAQPQLHGAVNAALAHVSVIRDEEFLHEVRVVEEVGLERPSGEKRNVAIVTGGHGRQT